jgi:hypothetical protein
MCLPSGKLRTPLFFRKRAKNYRKAFRKFTKNSNQKVSENNYKFSEKMPKMKNSQETRGN